MIVEKELLLSKLLSLHAALEFSEPTSEAPEATSEATSEARKIIENYLHTAGRECY